MKNWISEYLFLNGGTSHWRIPCIEWIRFDYNVYFLYDKKLLAGTAWTTARPSHGRRPGVVQLDVEPARAATIQPVDVTRDCEA
jgi:hypothetical protein